MSITDSNGGSIVSAMFVAVVMFLAPPVSATGSDLCASISEAEKGPALSGVCAALTAVNERDRAALSDLMADDFSLFGATGKYFASSRSMMVERWTADPGEGSGGSSRLVAVHRSYRSGDVAFVAGEIEDRVTEKGTTRCFVHAFTDIWELRSGRWQWVQSHESGVRESECASGNG